MSDRQVIAESNSLRLLANQDDAELRYGDELLVVVPWCSWRSPSLVKTAELLLTCLRPRAPGYVPNERSLHPVGGCYDISCDTVRVFWRDAMPALEIARTILHEIFHACGSEARLNRDWIGKTERFIRSHPHIPLSAYQSPTPTRDLAAATPAEQQEETSANLFVSMVGPKLGIPAPWREWFDRSTLLSFDSLKRAIRDAKRAADFTFGK